MATAINSGLKEENIVTLLDAGVLHSANTKLVILTPEDSGLHLNYTGLRTLTAMLLRGMLFCIHTAAYRKMKLKLIFVKAMDVPQLRQHF